jgi:hypothetical protein
MRRLIAASGGLLLALVIGVSSVAANGLGPPHVGFYVHDDMYRTVGTPTNFEFTGAPDWSFDTIYALGGELTNVAEAAPGDTDYNGGRWMVVPIIWTNISPTQFTNADQVMAAEQAGDIDFGPVAAYFDCPVIPLH